MKGNKSHPFQLIGKLIGYRKGFDLIRQNHDVIDGEVIENALFSDGLFTFTLLYQ